MSGYQHLQEHSSSIINSEDGAGCLSNMMVTFCQTTSCMGWCVWAVFLSLWLNNCLSKFYWLCETVPFVFSPHLGIGICSGGALCWSERRFYRVSFYVCCVPMNLEKTKARFWICMKTCVCILKTSADMLEWVAAISVSCSWLHQIQPTKIW